MSKKNRKDLFTCKGKRLANYLISRGSKLIQTINDEFIFIKDKSIEENLEQWEKDKIKWLF